MKALNTLLATSIICAAGTTGFAQSISRIATMPKGAEVTGLMVNGMDEVFLTAQHPGGKNALKEGGKPALIGYIAGFDTTTHTAADVAIPPEGERATVKVSGGSYVTLAKAGEALGDGTVLGGVYDTSGKLMYISNAPDFNGFVPTGANKAYLYTGWEGAGRDGASTVTRLPMSRVDGKWQADAGKGRTLDLSSIDGALVVCSGVVTPWGSPLIAEEYFFFNSAVWNHPDNFDDDERPGYKGGNDVTYIKPKSMNTYLGKMSNPYRYGYLFEINGAATENDYSLVKHYATGRLSHETAAIMPDAKTLYMSDDDSAKYNSKKYNTASGGVLFKFVADTKGDLSAGTLSAAKMTQDATADPTKAGFDIEWITLAHGTNAQIAGWIAEYDNVTVADYKEGETSYLSNADIQAWAEGKSGKDLNGDGTIASYPDDRPAFLESRRAAAALGATNEWDKLEGITSAGNDVFIAASALSWTMDKSWGQPDWMTGARDETDGGAIALNKEDCGGVYKGTTGNDYNLTRIDPYVIGTTTEDGRCDENNIANPDNILAMSDGTLLIGEDAGKKKHTLDMVWLAK